jgi:predicted GIY-YIG superfamily endonuclease
MQNFYVYILLCKDGSYYVGHTDNMEARLSAHEQRFFPRCYTAPRLPVKLVYVQEMASRDEAFRAERQLKRWNRSKKQALIDGNFALLQQLAKSYWT